MKILPFFFNNNTRNSLYNINNAAGSFSRAESLINICSYFVDTFIGMHIYLGEAPFVYMSGKFKKEKTEREKSAFGIYSENALYNFTCCIYQKF